MACNISINDIKVLFYLLEGGATNPMKARGIENITKGINELYEVNKKNGVNASISTMRRIIKRLNDEQLVEEGYKKNQKKTYFVGTQGIALVEKLNRENGRRIE